jgi:hypothetical protein
MLRTPKSFDQIRSITLRIFAGLRSGRVTDGLIPAAKPKSDEFARRL